ncbi:hypothetical protein H0H93_012543 [Arthromyces matolae]|nr:hypothetical protein H0H93_012543 [Arthromyces matolae]
MKVDSTKRTSTSTARGRGTYAQQACSICRGKKTKCDGNKPICGPCASSGRQDECSWGRESGRKPRTEAHFEAMRKRADALEEYVNLLESMLEKCRREHGGGADNGQSYLQFRPRDAEGMILPDEVDLDDNNEDINATEEDRVFSQELCRPTTNLKLEEGNLLLHGNTAVFRFAPERPLSPPRSRFPSNSKALRYVLLVDGADDTGYNPDFDWSRYLPATVPLDRKEHDRLLDLDVCWSLYVGRDFSIPFSSNSHARIPVPFVDTDFDSVEWHHPPSGVAAQPNHLSKTFAASCELLMIARRIMDVVNGLNNASVRHEVNHELISNIDLQLNTWKSNLSSDLDITLKSRPTATPHRIMMHCTYWWFFILLHRPFYHRKSRPTDRDIDHVKLCKRAAENIVELLGTWRTLYTLRCAPITLVQTAFSAGTVYLLGAVQAATGLRVAQESLKHSLAQVQLCVDYLFEIGKSWQCATNIGEILRGLLHEQIKPILDKRAIRTDGVTAANVQSQKQASAAPSVSPNPNSNPHLSRRRRSPSSQGRTPVSGKEDGRRGRPTYFQSSQSTLIGSSQPNPVTRPSTISTPIPYNLFRSSVELAFWHALQPASVILDYGLYTFKSCSDG